MSTGRRLGLLRVAGDRALDAVLGEVGPRHPVLRRAHVQLFRFDGIEAATTAELAAHAGMTKQSMHELITHLERAGYLTREPDPADTRARRIRLTPAGRELERQVHAAVVGVLEAWSARLGADRFDQLWELLREITGDRAPLVSLDELRRP